MNEPRPQSPLYGRETEQQALRATLSRVAHGPSEMVLIDGPIGGGKSALARTLRDAVEVQGGAFIYGRFERQQRDRPYTGLAEAFRGLIRRRLKADGDQLAQWKRRLEGVLEDEVRVLVDVLPELGELFPDAPSVRRLPGNEARTRFNRLFRGFVSTLAAEGAPLVVCFDDLQWADEASLSAISARVSDQRIRHLMLVATCRLDGDEAGALRAMVETLEAGETSFARLTLGPLDVPAVTTWIRESIGEEAAGDTVLVQRLIARTGGLPLYLKALFRRLKHEGMLNTGRFGPFDGPLGVLSEIFETLETVDPDTLVAGCLDPLSTETRAALQVASALGGLFDVSDLAEIEERSITELQQLLQEAVELELVEVEHAHGRCWYRFAHDAVQQVAYGGLSLGERARIHRLAGLRLLARTTSTRQDTRIFQVAFHLTRALSTAPETFDADSRYAVARVNRQAARIARRDAAFKAALSHLQAAVKALPEDTWARRYALTFELHSELMTIAWLADRTDAVEWGFEAALPYARTALQKGGLYRTLIAARTRSGDNEGASAAVYDAMAAFGVKLPDDDASMEDVERLGRRIHQTLRERPLGSLLDAPMLADPAQRMIAELIVLSTSARWVLNPQWGLWVGAFLVDHALTHGVSEATPFGLVCWPTRPRGDKPTQFEARRLGIALARKLEDQRSFGITASLSIINGGFLGWGRPQCIALAREAFRVCDALNEPIYACYALATLSVVELIGSGPMARLAADAAARADYVRQVGFEQALMEHIVPQIAARRLLGEGPREHLYRGRIYSEDDIIEQVIDQPGMAAAAAVLWMTEVRRHLTEGRPEEAWRVLEKAEPTVSMWEEGLCLPEMALLTGLAAGQMAERVASREGLAAAQPWRQSVQVALESLIPYTDFGTIVDDNGVEAPPTYDHGVAMLRAELAALDGDLGTAWSLMQQAMEGAQAMAHLGDQVLSCGRGAQFAQRLGMQPEYRRCLESCRASAQAWGAVNRVAQIDSLISHHDLQAVRLPEQGVADIIESLGWRCPSMEGPLDAAAEKIRARLQAMRVFIARPQGSEWRIEGFGREKNIGEGSRARTKMPEALFDQVLQSGEARTSTAGGDLLNGCQCAGWVTAMPIRVAKQAVGVLAIEGNRPEGGGCLPTEADHAVMDQLPGLLAGPLEALSHKAALEKTQHALEEAQSRISRLEQRMKGEGSSRSITLISKSPAFQEVADRARQVARSETPVLLKGEPGTGKGYMARAIHQLSARQSGPFIQLSGGRLSPAEVEAHYEMAEGGTLFIQELSALDGAAQGDLLGRIDDPDTSVRLVVGTRHDLEALIPTGKFREDLFYRISVFPLVLPPLRRRLEDLPMAVQHILEVINGRMQRAFTGVTDEGMVRLRRHRWPGNLAELENVLNRAAMVHDEEGPLPIPDHLLPDDATSGQSLGSYRLISELGRGGMGEVWKAQHQYLRRPAAIKLISNSSLSQSAGDTEGRQRLVRRFEREAQATAALRSPHSVELYDYGIGDDGAFFYVMELLEGIDLQQMVERFGPLPAERVVSLMVQICRSLAEAHAAGLVHRDIKAANVYACRVGVETDFVKVLDFGLVKHVGPVAELETGLTMEGVIQGTPAYMAPELALGDSEADHRVDLYALGCLGYWLLTGMLPFEAPNVMKLLMKHIQTPPPRPSTQVELDVPEGLEQVIMQLLAKSPEDRFQSAREVERALLQVDVSRPWDHDRAELWWRRHLPDLAVEAH
ncbi:MAG: AAA family ATPase [Bradymonadia bacterium]